MSESRVSPVEAETEDGVEARGATIEEAVSTALSQLGANREQVEVQVLSPESRALPGERLSTGERRVRVYRIDEHAANARALLEELLTRMEVPCRVSVRRGTGTTTSSSGGPVILDIAGDDLGLLIGWRGETLRSLQTAVNLMLGEEGVETRRVILDVERYRARREDQVRELAQRLALRVKRTGEAYTLDPMHAYERQVIHMTLAEDPDVTTESSGREPARRVVINPTGPAQGGPPERFEEPDRAGRPGGPTDQVRRRIPVRGDEAHGRALPGRASVAIAFMVRVGSRYETESEAGISHFVEHMVFKGGRRYPTARDVSEAIEGVGGVLNAATDREATVFWTRVPADKLALAVSVLADMLLAPALDNAEVLKERQVVIEELRTRTIPRTTCRSPSTLSCFRIIPWAGTLPVARRRSCRSPLTIAAATSISTCCRRRWS